MEKRSNPVRRLVWGVTSLLFLFMLLISFTLVFLPYWVSTGYFKSFVEHQSSRLIRGRILLNRIEFAWNKGIEIRGLEILADNPVIPSPVAGIRSARLKFNLWEILRTRFINTTLEAEGASLTWVRTEQGLTTSDLLIRTESRTDPPPVSRNRPLTSLLPFPVRAGIRVKAIQIRIHDRMLSRHVEFHDGSIDVDFSTLNGGVAVTASSDAVLDGERLPRVDITLSGKNFLGSRGEIDLENAVFNMEIQAPGITAGFTGNPKDRQFSGLIRTDLHSFMPVLSPFLNLSFQPVNASGTLTCKVAAHETASSKIEFDAEIDGKKVILRKKPSQTEAGPVDFTTRHRGYFNPIPGEIVIEKGEIRFLDVNHLSWHGRLMGMKSSNPILSLTIGPLFLSGKGVLKWVEPFLAKNGIISVSEKEGRFPKIRLDVASFRTDLSTGTGEFRVEKAGASSPLLLLRLQGIPGETSVEEIDFSLRKMNVRFDNFFPEQFEMSSSASLTRIASKGNPSVLIKKIRIPDFHLRADNIRRITDAHLGLTSLFSVKGSILIGETHLSPILKTGEVRNSFDLGGSLTTESILDLVINDYQMNASKIIFFEKTASVSMPQVSVSLSGDGFRLKNPESMRLDINRFNLIFNADGDAVRIAANGSLTDSGMGGILTSGKMTLDLNKAGSILQLKELR
ncbi:MAG: hypothetical protein AB1659_07815, partial [Thermodesulfobacteriota bacterium]